MLNYGTIFVQLDQGSLVIELKDVKKPQTVVDQFRKIISHNVPKQVMNFEAVIKLLNFSNLSDQQLGVIIEKIIDNIEEERFVQIISQFIQIEEDEEGKLDELE